MLAARNNRNGMITCCCVEGVCQAYMTCGYFVHNFICVLIKWHKDDFHIEQRTSHWSTFFFAYIFAHFIYAYISLYPNHCNSFQFGIEFFFIIAFSTWDFSCYFFFFFSAGKQLNLTSSCHISWIITSFHGFCILHSVTHFIFELMWIGLSHLKRKRVASNVEAECVWMDGKISK